MCGGGEIGGRDSVKERGTSGDAQTQRPLLLLPHLLSPKTISIQIFPQWHSAPSLYRVLQSPDETHCYDGDDGKKGSEIEGNKRDDHRANKRRGINLKGEFLMLRLQIS